MSNTIHISPRLITDSVKMPLIEKSPPTCVKVGNSIVSRLPLISTCNLAKCFNSEKSTTLSFVLFKMLKPPLLSMDFPTNSKFGAAKDFSNSLLCTLRVLPTAPSNGNSTEAICWMSILDTVISSGKKNLAFLLSERIIELISVDKILASRSRLLWAMLRFPWTLSNGRELRKVSGIKTLIAESLLVLILIRLGSVAHEISAISSSAEKSSVASTVFAVSSKVPPIEVIELEEI